MQSNYEFSETCHGIHVIALFIATNRPKNSDAYVKPLRRNPRLSDDVSSISMYDDTDYLYATKHNSATRADTKLSQASINVKFYALLDDF